MTKNELISQLASRCNISVSQASRVINALLETMIRNLLTGDRLEIRGFGAFHMKVSQPQERRNPRTQQVVRVGERRGMAFRASSLLLRRLNQEQR